MTLWLCRSSEFVLVSVHYSGCWPVLVASYACLCVVCVIVPSRCCIALVLPQEVRCLMRCRKAGIRAPAPVFVDEENSRIFLEKVSGDTARAFLTRSDVAHRKVLFGGGFVCVL